MNEYTAGTVASATVNGVPNVTVLRRKTEAGYDWAFTPNPAKGIKYSCSSDPDYVTDIEILIEGVGMTEFDDRDLEKWFRQWIDWRDPEHKEVAATDSDGEKVDFHDWWYEGYTPLTTPFGEMDIIEHEVGKAGTVEYNDGYNLWTNWIIIQIGERYFRLKGEYDSWDPEGWDKTVDEVERKKITIDAWEKKND